MYYYYNNKIIKCKYDVNIVKDVYNRFNINNISKSKLSLKFLDSLEFNNNVYEFKNNQLEIGYILWSMNKYYNYFKSKKTNDSTLDSIFKTMNNDLDNVNDNVNENEKDEDNVNENDEDNVNEDKEDLEDVKKDLDDVNENDENVDNVNEDLDYVNKDDEVLDNEKIIAKTKYDNLVKAIDINKLINETIYKALIETHSIIEAYNHDSSLFKKRTLQLNNTLYSSLETDKIPYIVNLNDLLIVIYFKNKNTEITDVAYFTKDHIEYLANLNDFGLTDIEIQCITFFDNKSIVKHLIDHYITENLTANLKNVYYIKKVIKKSDIKSPIILSIIEFIYSIYNVDFSANNDINTVYNDFNITNIKNCRLFLNALVDINIFITVMNYLQIPIQYLKNKSEPIKISFSLSEKLNTVMKFPSIVNKSDAYLKSMTLLSFHDIVDNGGNMYSFIDLNYIAKVSEPSIGIISA